MPFTGTESKEVAPHVLGRWYRNANGAVFRLWEPPQRVLETEGRPICHAGEVELLNGSSSILVWRWKDTVLLPWWTSLPLFGDWLTKTFFPMPVYEPARHHLEKGKVHEEPIAQDRPGGTKVEHDKDHVRIEYPDGYMIVRRKTPEEKGVEQ
jgi:hypothetical protein